MKTKKTIFSICLAVILLLSSIVLFACGNKVNSADALASYSTVISEIKKDTALFKPGTINGMQTNFYLNDFAYKNESDQLVYGNNYYLAFLAVGLDFIEEYHTALDGLKNKGDYAALQDDVKDLTKKLNTLKTDHDNLINETNGLDYSIYNGYFARYRTSALNFINESYSCALNLGKFLNKEAKLAKTVGTEEMTAEAFEFYCDYNILKVFDDFREYMMDSCKGIKIDGLIFDKVFLSMVEWNKNIVKQEYKILDVESATALMNAFRSVDGERASIKTALSKFSIYKFVNTYGYSVESYKKANGNASAYFDRISYYFLDTVNTLDSLYNYLFKNVVA